jgi:hypothetical protein
MACFGVSFFNFSHLWYKPAFNHLCCGMIPPRIIIDTEWAKAGRNQKPEQKNFLCPEVNITIKLIIL